ncbi:bifunctional [glutamate--ammonia ligase]-adenylyl-L-tyrosine phosphorylase/[glutamate--ammonia-ligase] adenylyltransferase [Glaciecola sp. 1036]|uniref:bifunctional [glutamate--ammonia ligase]-adenylyl-L-tyrosine phosphorylase/[glutamate--ammonia-ligase] adenylyltransferase n=1 Tax=Alteromonadaceae TaxID=72275 RepID=UPI003CFEEB7E
MALFNPEHPTEHVIKAYQQLLQELASIATFEPAIYRVLSLSDFVLRTCEQFPALFAPVLFNLLDSKQVDTSHYAAFSDLVDTSTTENELNNHIRQYRQIRMAEIAIADLLQLHSIETSLLQVSKLADHIICSAYYWHYENLAKRYGYPERKQHLQIMGMGKLGGQELNFSSDIDLIFAYSFTGETQEGRKPVEHQVFFTKLAQKLIASLDQVNQFGRAYRVDMRLRPMGDSGPLVLPLNAFEHYLQEQGREWERFAMQKMRIINPNPFSQELIDIVKPFVYRKYIDFTTIESIREMKLLIEKEVRRKQIENNIKLGKGGIREVEFFAQSQQLIHAGRQPDCQQQSLLVSLKNLSRCQIITDDTAKNLRDDYLFLRLVEQYLQIFNDEQTQTLPEDEKDQQRLAYVLGYPDFTSCVSQIDASMQRIHSIFSDLIDTSEDNQENEEVDENYIDLWRLDLNLDEQLSLLPDNMQDQSKTLLCEQIHELKDKIHRSIVSPKGEKSLQRLMPQLIQEISVLDDQGTPEPEANGVQNCISGVFAILQTVLGRTTYIDLLNETPDVRNRLYLLCRKSPWVAKQIARFPILLDELLHPNYLTPEDLSVDEFKRQLADDLRQILLRIPLEDVESQMDALRQFKHAQQLRIAAADISKTLPINKVSDRLTVLAEVLLSEVVEQAWYQICEKFGRPNLADNQKGLGIIAYGKFGGIELSYGSDLDLVFLYDADRTEKTDDSGNRQPISHQDFYTKLVQRISHLCSTQTYQGILYEIDLRLRPSGNSGLLISHIDSYAEYQQQEAWTWEHQALTRARFICGQPSLEQRFIQVRKQILSQFREPATLKQEILEMREKMRQHLDKSTAEAVDLKQCIGGIVDIEFTVQYIVLLNAHKSPELTQWSDNLRILETANQLGFINDEQMQRLQESYLWLRHKGHRLQLADKKQVQPSTELSKYLNNVRRFSCLFSGGEEDDN